jgi:hypothetical protein
MRLDRNQIRIVQATAFSPIITELLWLPSRIIRDAKLVTMYLESVCFDTSPFCSTVA